MRPPATDEVSGLRDTVNRVQKDISALMDQLTSRSRRPENSLSSSSSFPTGPYPDITIPSLPSTSSQGLDPWAALPPLFSDTNPAASLSVVPKKPEIADVVPGHSASLFTSRE